jgi:hypothetical protein
MATAAQIIHYHSLFIIPIQLRFSHCTRYAHTTAVTRLEYIHTYNYYYTSFRFIAWSCLNTSLPTLFPPFFLSSPSPLSVRRSPAVQRISITPRLPLLFFNVAQCPAPLVSPLGRLQAVTSIASPGLVATLARAVNHNVPSHRRLVPLLLAGPSCLSWETPSAN